MLCDDCKYILWDKEPEKLGEGQGGTVKKMKLMHGCFGKKFDVAVKTLKGESGHHVRGNHRCIC